MSEVAAQYEAFPYPERDPAEERTRLITGSPSHPLEIDHFLFAGKRDWSRPLRALFAGGGTGDGLIQLAQLMAWAGRPAEITYIDLSRASRKIAEERARIRGLTGIEFVTGSLLEAAARGPFDYVDCCGVLHHLDDPQAGFDALSAALAAEGGIGLMVYAPYGRSGVYPLQEAFGTLFDGLAPEARLVEAKRIVAGLPSGHPFRLNPHLGDHERSDAGFYDLLLHSQDRPFSIGELDAALGMAGLDMVGVTQPALYDPARLLPEGVRLPEGLSPIARMALGERLRGTIRTHVAYAVKAGRGVQALARPTDLSLVPHLKGVEGPALARAVAAKGQVRMGQGVVKVFEPLEKSAAPLIGAIDGRRTLAEIARRAGLDPIGFGARWAPVHRALGDWGLMLYARPFRG
ncbi:class I SAM-dependent methyltransferase [Rhodovulum marinum]|uniref:Methyltransferase family protein n=1 Tax=Rhodovulum marinum TaxID=320662 RepID=A0A4R2Q3E0_9RHOB|nr:class I SAM-dependent methyltransferase [Rhodovulum marinum]TCP42354.1 methyltransferase family protein [Rhodovulum marinum]